ncbi:hypothetical protein PUR61_38595 [Streptomyces sp. BE20]|uniref:hypothetical protein n=1 Tax=Streptomyces sp. BE20 TaxID=3002525 RepID=UPI002E7A2AFD|nr:hypothetical protein [Streptomyces sp. BE20]MEE1828046.1 hypothetical protein [Streptomyces sp. BE20]
MPSRTLPGPRTAALLRVTLDAAPLIAAVSADLPTHRGTLVTYAFHSDSVTARLRSGLTTAEHDTITSTLTDRFAAAGWGWWADSHGIDLTHPFHVTRNGSARTLPDTLTDTLTAATSGPGHDTDVLSHALAAADHTDMAAVWHTSTLCPHRPAHSSPPGPASVEVLHQCTFCGAPRHDTPTPDAVRHCPPRYRLHSTLD